MKKVEAKTEEVVENKIIMIGGSDPSMAGLVLKSLKDNAAGATIYELDGDEMQLITNRRMNRVQSDQIKDYMEDEGNKKRALLIATEIHKRWKNEFFMKHVELKELKNDTNYSWSKFNEIIATLDMFGFVSWEDKSQKALRIVLSEFQIIENKKKEAQAIMDLAKGKLLELKEMVKEQSDKTKINSYIKKMKLNY